MLISTYLPIITLNVNELNAPIKRNRMGCLYKKQDPSICCYKRLISEIKTQNESAGMEKYIPSKWKQKA